MYVPHRIISMWWSCANGQKKCPIKLRVVWMCPRSWTPPILTLKANWSVGSAIQGHLGVIPTRSSSYTFEMLDAHSSLFFRFVVAPHFTPQCSFCRYLFVDIWQLLFDTQAPPLDPLVFLFFLFLHPWRYCSRIINSIVDSFHHRAIWKTKRSSSSSILLSYN